MPNMLQLLKQRFDAPKFPRAILRPVHLNEMNCQVLRKKCKSLGFWKEQDHGIVNKRDADWIQRESSCEHMWFRGFWFNFIWSSINLTAASCIHDISLIERNLVILHFCITFYLAQAAECNATSLWIHCKRKVSGKIALLWNEPRQILFSWQTRQNCTSYSSKFLWIFPFPKLIVGVWLHTAVYKLIPSNFEKHWTKPEVCILVFLARDATKMQLQLPQNSHQCSTECGNIVTHCVRLSAQHLFLQLLRNWDRNRSLLENLGMQLTLTAKNTDMKIWCPWIRYGNWLPVLDIWQIRSGLYLEDHEIELHSVPDIRISTCLFWDFQQNEKLCLHNAAFPSCYVMDFFAEKSLRRC